MNPYNHNPRAAVRPSFYTESQLIVAALILARYPDTLTLEETPCKP
jgi:hypothetical protein